MFRRGFISFLLLLIGGMIYVVFRQDVIFLDHIPLAVLEKIRIEIDYSHCHWVVYLLVFCLPDALWYAALMIFQIWLYDGAIQSKMTFVFAASIPFVYETLQKFATIRGTFDWLDVGSYLLTLIIIVLCQRKQLYL